MTGASRYSCEQAVVRAVLLAIREPGEAAVALGNETANNAADDIDAYVTPAMISAAFTAMIDAILLAVQNPDQGAEYRP